MAESATLTRRKAERIDSVRRGPKLPNEVEAVLEATERSHNDGEPKAGHWYFRVPQAGVRYYSL